MNLYFEVSELRLACFGVGKGVVLVLVFYHFEILGALVLGLSVELQIILILENRAAVTTIQLYFLHFLCNYKFCLDFRFLLQ